MEMSDTLKQRLIAHAIRLRQHASELEDQKTVLEQELARNKTQTRIIAEEIGAILTWLQCQPGDLRPTNSDVNCDYFNQQGEDDMKYHNVTFKKTPSGKTWYTRLRAGGKQYYLSASTQNKLKIKIKELLKNVQPQDQLLLQQANQQKGSGYTFGQFYKIWLDVFKKNIKATTRRSYETIYKRFSAQFCKTSIEQISTLLIVRELDRYAGTRSGQQLYVLAKDVLEKAKRQRLIEYNPLDNVPTPKYIAPERHVLNREQQQRFAAACQHSRCGDFYLVALWQGLRRGEILMLKPNDIDLQSHTLRVDESITDRSNETTTKNKFSNRTMPLFAKTEQILQKYLGLPADERIFKTDTKTLSEELVKILAAANLPKITAHELRHTFITYCRDNNVPEHVVQKWVGHQIGSAVTGKTYTHVTDETSKRYYDLLNNI